MNRKELDIMNTLLSESFVNQRLLSEASGHSLGVVNRSIKNLMEDGMVDEDVRLTEKAKKEFESKAPRNAIILAAGYGMRMVPINTQIPKALIEVNGEIMIERTIKQLQEVGVRKIYVVVGFMKEQFEYLIDQYGVELIVNTDYAIKNNLHSLALASNYIANTYIVPCDIWCDRNPFNRHELYSWYMVSDYVDDESSVRVNRKMELVSVDHLHGGNQMIGISYLVGKQAEIVQKRLIEYDRKRNYKNSFWEEVLLEKDKMILQARVVHAADVVEINTYEQLKDLDEDSEHLNDDSITTIARALNISEKEIKNIEVLKKGMTNRSFLFTCQNQKYIMRIPGEGTDQLINRKEEAAVYSVIKGCGICDEPVYLNPVTGYKITRYLQGVRACDCNNKEDLIACMEKLREFHCMGLKVEHTFDIFEKIVFYESLWKGKDSIYKDYEKTKEDIFKLKNYIEKTRKNWCLTHIDAVPDNFVFYAEKGEEKLQLIDWEYAGMQDPHVDVAMFCIYSLYEKKQVDELIDIYFENRCDEETRTKIYCYIAACGLLWSNWCEYKRNLGVEFGEYSLKQYRYAKEYYKYARERMNV